MNTYDDDDYSLFVGDKKIDGFTDGDGTLFEKRSDAKHHYQYNRDQKV